MRTFLYSYDQLLKMRQLLLAIVFICFTAPPAEALALKQTCINYLKKYKSYFKEEALVQICGQALVQESCRSDAGEPIFHMDYNSKKISPKKILVLSLIHGDEKQAGELARFWLERLSKLEARNSWRIIPIANPDGVNKNTRTNAKGVDLNRNFPTLDWSKDSIKYWEKFAQKSPRRFPGAGPASEPETKCYLKHFEDYRPDFVVSIHTPLNVLDFDGPKLKTKPRFEYLPWKSLGTFPGSLGKYLWVEKGTPVLTTELKNSLPKLSVSFEQLQDLIGTLVKTDLK